MSQTNPSRYGGEVQLAAATMPEPEFEAIPLSQTTPEPVQTAEFAGPGVLAAPSDDDLDYAWRGDAYGLSVSGLEVGPQDLYAMRPVSERLGSGETTAFAQAGEGAYNKLQAQWDWAGSALSSAWQQLSTDPIGALVQGTGAVLSFAGNAVYDTALLASDQIAVSSHYLSGGLISATDALQRNVGRTESVFGGVYNIEQAIDNKDYGLAGGLAVEGFEAALLTLITRGRGGQSVDAPNMQTIATSLSGNTKELASISTLNNRQLSILDNLSDAGSPASFHKKAVSMSDLQALTRVTGDEFSMYTLGSRRTIIRGSSEKVIVNQDVYDGLISGLYGKWSGHTHRPGYSIDPGPSDRPMLTNLGQKQSSIWPANADTKPYLFGQIGKADDLRLQSDVTRKLWEKLYGQ